ncbi:MAG: cysteine--tRNA ligase [Spirochaetales bacterium]|nr:cysteine--tRNA ligase [Spirochaetales bacterium]
MAFHIYNTMSRSKEELVPLDGEHVRMYTCGPTVYNYAHIGNLRAYLFDDILRRVLEYAGYKVDHVVNITDVGHLTDDNDEGEDKMVKSSRETGKSVWDIAEFYTEAFFKDIDSLNIIRPTVTPKATDHINEMIAMIKRLEEKGFTYEAGGNIYFNIDKSPDYGKLALRDRQDLHAGARIKVDSNKKNPHDFVLWFTRSKFEHQAMVWDSPWGRGYPGWHIECSAMSMKYLGEQFDIHCGGIDHISIHHTNEIAQSEAATGRKWVNYWMHNEFLIMNKGKMAKSSGNFLTLDSLADDGFSPLDYRYFTLGGHYRSQLQFSKESLSAAARARKNLFDKVIRLKGETNNTPSSIISQEGQIYIKNFQEHLSTDLNTPRVLGELWLMLKDVGLGSQDKLAIIYEFDKILGFNLENLEEVEAESLDSDILELIDSRNNARKEKNWEKADKMRDILLEKGIIIKDTPNGTEWTRNV